MSLHNDIMNLQVDAAAMDDGIHPGNQSARLAYKLGHHDARHAAAELAAKSDARMGELVAASQAVLHIADRDTDEFNALRRALANAAKPL